MTGTAATSQTSPGKEVSSPSRSPERRDSDKPTSENGSKKDKKEKEKEKDTKPCPEGDFAYEYVQLAQVSVCAVPPLRNVHFTTYSMVCYGISHYICPLHPLFPSSLSCQCRV
jgi:hypothetical protein